MKRFLSQLFLFSLSVLLFSLGCRKKLEVASWNVDVLAPLATGSVNLADYIKNKNVTVDDGQLIHVTASDTVLSIGLDTLIGIPDYSVDTSFFVPFGGISVPPGVPFLTQIDDKQFNLKDVRLTHAIVRESSITVELDNTINKPVLFRYEIASASLNGDTFRIEKRVEAKSKFEEDYNLNGYELDLRGSEGKSYNTVITKIEVMIHPDEPNAHTFAAGESFDVSSTVTNVIPEYAIGYFGNQVADYNERQTLDLLSQFPFKEVNITDFDVTMTIDNGIGADLLLVVNKLGSKNTSSGAVAELDHEIIGATQQFTRAINLYQEGNPVKHIRKTISFTDENSNLDELLEIRPNEFTADLSIRVNPLGNISFGNDFVYYGHNLTATIDLDVPLVVGLKGLALSDTTAFNYDTPSEKNPLDRVNQGLVKFVLDNYYPFDAGVQFMLLDSSGVFIDSLLAQQEWIAGALENAAGRVETPARSVIEIAVNQDRLANMATASLLKADIVLNTVGSDSVHVRSNQRIDFKIVADLNVRTGDVD